eukprot:9066578-Pyramimonas_sp.AAC.1
MPPDLPVLGREKPTETSDHSRGQMMRKVCIEAIAQGTAVAKTSRSLRTKTTFSGQHYYDEGDSVDYHCPATTKGDWGRLEWPIPSCQDDPENDSSHHSSGKPRCSGT